MVIFYNVSKWPAAGQGSLYAPFNACLQSPEDVCKVVVCDLRSANTAPAYCSLPVAWAFSKKKERQSDEKPPLYYINCSQSKQLLSRSLRVFLDFNCRHKRLNFFRRFFFFRENKGAFRKGGSLKSVLPKFYPKRRKIIFTFVVVFINHHGG